MYMSAGQTYFMMKLWFENQGTRVGDQARQMVEEIGDKATIIELTDKLNALNATPNPVVSK